MSNVINQDFSMLREQQQQLDPEQQREINQYQSAQRVRFNAARKETQDITLTTEEGDKVTISALSNFKASYMSFDYTEQLKGKSMSFEGEQFKASSKTAFQMTVEGDLNEEEMQDIREVIEKLDGLMGDLVSGNHENILKEAPGLLDDTETLSSLEAVLKYQQRVSMDYTSMTRQTGVMGEGGMPSFNPGNLPPMPHEKPVWGQDLIATIAGRVIDMMESTNTEMDKMKEPVKNYFKEMMDKISLEQGANEPISNLVQQLNAELLDRMGLENPEAVENTQEPVE